MAKYYGDWRIFVAPDHPTPVATRGHNANPIPYLIWGPGIEANGAAVFSEAEAAKGGGEPVVGHEALRTMIER